jgi:ferrous-iron efflux pump FieF
VISLHDLRTRSSGTKTFIQFHLEMDGNLTLLEAHEIADDVMDDIEHAFPDAEVLIHEDPFGVKERRVRFQ